MLTDCGGTITDGKRRLLPWGSGQEPAGSSVSKVREIERRREDSDDQFNREIDQNFVREQRENARLSKARAEAEAAEMARALEGIARAIAAGRGGGGSFGDGGGRLDTETDGIWHFKTGGAIECEGDCVHYVSTLLARAPLTGTPLAWEINSAAEIAIWFHNGDKKGGNCSFVAGGRLFKAGTFTFQRVN